MTLPPPAYHVAYMLCTCLSKSFRDSHCLFCFVFSLCTGKSSFALSKYVCEFGNLVRGSVKTKTFRIVNTGHSGLVLAFDKRLLNNTGFSITPEKFGRIPGAPNNEAMEVEVTFQSKVRSVRSCPIPGVSIC